MSGPCLMSQVHLLGHRGQLLAFSPSTMGLWAVSDRVGQVLGVADGRSFSDMVSALAGVLEPAAVTSLLARLEQAGMVAVSRAPAAAGAGALGGMSAPVPLHPVADASLGIRHLTLYLTQRCNLCCRYCLTRASGALGVDRMSPEVARAAVDLLLDRCGSAEELIVAFYGGEPLLELELLEEVVDRAERRATEDGRVVRFSITTNGALLSERACRVLAAHPFSVSVSLDPDPARHDRDRPMASGTGSFDAVASGVHRLVAHGVRATAKVVVTPGMGPLIELGDRLLAMGFGDVSFEPALSLAGGDHPEGLGLEAFAAAIAELLDQVAERGTTAGTPVRAARALGALAGREPFGYGCDAGRHRVAVAADGTILPCESFIGVDELAMGHVLTGLDPRVGQRLGRLMATPAEDCRTCWARPLCSGPCAQFSFRRYGDPRRPIPELCRLRQAEVAATLACFHELRSRRAVARDRAGDAA